MRVFKNKFGQWETVFKNKLENGEELRYYMSVQFQRGFEPVVDSIDIMFVRWWGRCYLSKDGTKPKLFIAEWREIVPKIGDTFEAEAMDRDLHKEDEPEINIEQEELPFY